MSKSCVLGPPNHNFTFILHFFTFSWNPRKSRFFRIFNIFLLYTQRPVETPCLPSYPTLGDKAEDAIEGAAAGGAVDSLGPTGGIGNKMVCGYYIMF